MRPQYWILNGPINMVVVTVILTVVLSCNITVEHQGRKKTVGNLETVGYVKYTCVYKKKSETSIWYIEIDKKYCKQ